MSALSVLSSAISLPRQGPSLSLGGFPSSRQRVCVCSCRTRLRVRRLESSRVGRRIEGCEKISLVWEIGYCCLCRCLPGLLRGCVFYARMAMSWRLIPGKVSPFLPTYRGTSITSRVKMKADVGLGGRKVAIEHA